MKRLILLVVVLLLFVGSAGAEETKPTALEFCTGISELCKTFVQARYAGVPLSETIAISPAEYHWLAVAAYKLPPYMGDEMRREAATEFANQMFIKCLEDLSK